MQQAESKTYLESKSSDNFFENLKTALQAVMQSPDGSGLLSKIKALVSNKTSRSLLTRKTAELGLLLINELAEYKDNNTYNSQPAKVVYKNKRYNRIEELLGEREWDDPENYDLLIYLFGEKKAAYARYAWKDIPNQMYQSGYNRRSFRSPNEREIYFVNQMDFMVQLLPQTYTTKYNSSGVTLIHYDLPIAEQVRYNHAIGDHNPALFRLWSAAIDMNDAEVFEQIEAIIFNKDEEGKVTRNIIKALLNSNKTEAWVLVEKLLLAAQRQEGLRQTILEALDETSIGAMKYIIGVIIDNQLTRFSSVVRAIDMWAGLGWESERETTVKNFLKKAQFYLNTPENIPEGIRNENNADIYMALWAQGVYDVEKTVPYLHELTESDQSSKRTLALLFVGQTAHYKITMPFYYAALNDRDIEPLACAINAIKSAVEIGENNKYYDQYYPHLFSELEKVYNRITPKEKTIENFIFSWTKIKFEKRTILQAMICMIVEKQERLNTALNYFDDMDAVTKRQLSRMILPVHAAYNYKYSGKKSQPLTEFQRNYAMLILKDRSEYEIAFFALQDVSFASEELKVFPDLLKRKAAGFRNKLIELLLHQQDELIPPVIEELILTGDPEQRLAALDILLQLKKNSRMPTITQHWASEFQNRKSISTKEEILLSQLTGAANTISISAEEGYGLFNPRKQSNVVNPKIDPTSLYEKLLAKHKFGFSRPVSDIKKAIDNLFALFLKHKDFEYEVEHWNNSKEKILLGNSLRRKNFKSVFATAEEEYKDYPLYKLWATWYTTEKLQPVDLFLLLIGITSDKKKYTRILELQLPLYDDLFSPALKNVPYYLNPVFSVTRALQLIHPFIEVNEFCIGACNRLFASLDQEVLQSKDDGDYYHAANLGWQSNEPLNRFLKLINYKTLTASEVKQYWDLYNWWQYSGLKESISLSMPPLTVFGKAYERGVIGEDDLIRGMMTPGNIQALSQKKIHKHENDFFAEFPFMVDIFKRISDLILDVELKRGDSESPVSHLASSLQSLQGVNRLTEILAGLGKTNLFRGYIYSFNSDNNKQQVFSTLIKRCMPAASDTQALFDDSMARIKVSEKRLIEVAVYAPQWQKFISSYLGWKGLDSAIWWMHAHTKTDAYHAQNAEAESEVAKYSTLDVEEFKQGAVDKDWFLMAYEEIGKDKWPMVYDAAKYISDGNGHRRARIYADVLLGNLTLDDVVEKIKSKRDQDYLRIYGLVPLNKKHPGKDILERYEYVQVFRKESKQFGSLKQTSENAAIKIALENLARNAGYPDPIRFTWAMETTQVQLILAKETQVQYEDILIGLVIDEEGEADVVAFKDDKQLKAIPSKYKKDVKVLELQGFKKTLREQFRRASRGLEDAMVRGDEFLSQEISDLFDHPVISKQLAKLVFVKSHNDKAGQHGFYADKKLVSADKAEYVLMHDDKLRIAHCTDLYESGVWAPYQRHAFDKKLQQPFKQIFRELYLPTADELAEKSISRRYAGHQVQPKQTVALLKSRGWKVNYEEGLQKVYHKERFVVRMYAMADWFSPADVENPTLEFVRFEHLKTFEPVAFTAIHPRIFSEVMRDIDLVVSVAHAGSVDAEASHSSIEMRSVLLRETLRLFKITNAEIVGSHVTIKGKLGEYSVHLGSAIAHKMASGYLSILPVHSQQRGRLFLPFVDDDPKSAELISKVLLLARDSEIQDPTILGQIAD